MSSSSARTSDRVVSISLSVLVHGAIVAALLWGWWQYHTPKAPPPSLAIQGSIVRAPVEAPAPPTTPAVDPAVLARQQAEREHAEAMRHQAEQEAADRAAAAKAAAQLAAESARAAEAAREAEATRKVQDAQREQEQQAAALEAQRKAEAARKAKLMADLKAKQEAAREAQHLEKQLQSEQAQRQSEADLQSQLKAEEHLQALKSSPQEDEYRTLISAQISRFWNRPPSAAQGVRCTVHLTQIPGGEVTHVTVDNCNGDDALRQSVETAVYRASPLPAPPDPALFDPSVTLLFEPDD